MLERGPELRAIQELLIRAETGAGRLVVVAGDAGIGKSTLLDAASDDAPGRAARPPARTDSGLSVT